MIGRDELSLPMIICHVWLGVSLDPSRDSRMRVMPKLVLSIIDVMNSSDSVLHLQDDVRMLALREHRSQVLTSIQATQESK